MNPVLFGRAVYRAYGHRGILLRTVHEVRKRYGWFAHAPRVSLREEDVKRDAAAFIVNMRRLGATNPPEALERAKRVEDGWYQAYGVRWMPLPYGESWQVHPLTDFAYARSPWYRIRHLNPQAGDIKDVWEPARFGWAYDLIRGYAIAQDDALVEAFWRRTEDFLGANPPFVGVQWSCGQETGVRALAWLWAEAAFSESPASTPARRHMLGEALLWSGERIADAMGYAISQRNNHGLSESTALLALASRFSGDPQTDRWFDRAERTFNRLVRDQFADDGWYIQHSFNYLRVALEMCIVAARVCSMANRPLPSDVSQRIQAGIRLLASTQVGGKGDVPNHGPNDGAMTLPMTVADYRDFRPILSAAAAAFKIPLPAPSPISHAALSWIGSPPPDSEQSHQPLVLGSSGWATIRVGEVFVFARAGNYRSRPGHFDPLHLDIWFRGRPVACDAGTFRYSAPPPWSDGLRGITVHNTLDFPEFDLATRGRNFLWFGSPQAEIAKSSVGPDSVRLVMENASWAKYRIAHTRKVEVTQSSVIVSDTVAARPATRTRLHWLLTRESDAPEIHSSASFTVDAVTASEKSVHGWQSLYYASKIPAYSLTAETSVAPSGLLTFTSVFRFGP